MAKTTKATDKETRPFEQILRAAADRLRKNIDAVKYKHYLLGLLILKCVSYAFDRLCQKIVNKEREHAYDDPEGLLAYSSYYVFFVPQEERWNYIVSCAKLPTIGEDLDRAMDVLEKENALMQLLVQVPESYRGKVFNLWCGSMFVMSECSLLANQERLDEMTIYRKEVNQPTGKHSIMTSLKPGLYPSPYFTFNLN